jgi:cytochrome c5
MVSVVVLHGEPPSGQPNHAAAAGLQDFPNGGAARLVSARCLVCHGPELIVAQRLSRDAWGRELDKMAGWGAVVTDAERPVLLDYLSQQFGDASAAPSAVPSGDAGAAVAARRCLVCHDSALIQQQRLTADGWAREIDKMIGWGAGVTAAEQPLLVQYLTAASGTR